MQRSIRYFLVSVFLCLASARVVFAGAFSVGPIELTVNDLAREEKFFTQVLNFEKVTELETRNGEMDALLSLEGAQLRSAELKLGEERVLLTEHLRNKGRPIPSD